MNHDPLYTRLRETGWRRRLTDSELRELEAWLAAHPEAQADWDTELAFNEALTQLPDAPVPSNFTARVMSAVERHSHRRTRSPRSGAWFWKRLLPTTAFTGVVLAVGVTVFVEHYAQAASRARIARTLATTAALQNPDVLRDFDTIQRLSQTLPPDSQVIALLQ